MKVITQKEFDNFPVVDGYKQCPSGDYTKIKQFENDCSFGECCFFEGKCIIENEHIIKNQCPLLIFSGFGSVRRTTYFFNCEDGIWVRCGCFFGDIEQFRERVKKTRKGRLGKEYLMIADLVEMKWK